MGANKFGAMNKKLMISLGVLTVVAIIGGYFLYKHYSKDKFGMMNTPKGLKLLLQQATDKEKWKALEIMSLINGLPKKEQDVVMNNIKEIGVQNLVKNYINTYPRGPTPFKIDMVYIIKRAENIYKAPQKDQADQILFFLPVDQRMLLYDQFIIVSNKNKGLK